MGQDVPILIGTNLDEGALFFRPDMPLVKEDDLVRTIEMMTGIQDAAPITKEYPYSIDGHAQIMTDLYFWRSACNSLPLRASTRRCGCTGSIGRAESSGSRQSDACPGNTVCI